MANPTVIKLQDGNVMPQLGLGVWQASNEEVITAIQKALEFPSRPARCYSSLFRNAKYKDIIMQSRKLLKEQPIYIRDKCNGEVKNR